MSSNTSTTVEVNKYPIVTEALRPQYSMPRDPNYVVALEPLGETPEYIYCPHCHKRALTKVEKSASGETGSRFAACLCCLGGGIIGAVIPFLCHWCEDTDHHCSECKKLVVHKPHDGSGKNQIKRPRERPEVVQSQYAAMPAMAVVKPRPEGSPGIPGVRVGLDIGRESESPDAQIAL